MTKKYFLLFLSAVTALFAIYVSLFKVSSQLKPNQNKVLNPAAVKTEVTLVIDFGDKKPQTFTQAITPDSTAFSILKETANKENLKLITKQYSFGVFVQSINGKESSSKMAWIYFVNGASGTVAADQYKLKQGDKIEWKYTTPSE